MKFDCSIGSIISQLTLFNHCSYIFWPFSFSSLHKYLIKSFSHFYQICNELFLWFKLLNLFWIPILDHMSNWQGFSVEHKMQLHSQVYTGLELKPQYTQKKNSLLNQPFWNIPVIPVFRKLMQKDLDIFKVRLGYVVNYGLGKYINKQTTHNKTNYLFSLYSTLLLIMYKILIWITVFFNSQIWFLGSLSHNQAIADWDDIFKSLLYV